MKKLSIILLSILLAGLLLAGCSGTSEPKGTVENPYKLKLAGQFPADNPASIAAENIKKSVEEKSGGRLIIQTYPANQLGDAGLVFEGIMDGSVDMGLLYNSSQYNPMIEINSLPYLSTNMEDVRKVYAPGSNYYKIYSDIFDELNVKILGIHVDGLIGIHGVNKEPKNYTDLSKKKDTLVRIPSSDIYKIATADMGYPTVTVSFSDLYTALQTGVCDAATGQTAIGAYTGFRDVDKYFIPYRAFVECIDYMINKDAWNALPPDLQVILQDAINTEVENQFNNVEKLEDEYLQKLADKGVKILPITDEERAVMSEYVRATTWPKLYDKFGKDTLDQILQDVK
ncbi:MAG: TRAP transporter substrate-binding protein DctP [Eubacterium sp.]